MVNALPNHESWDGKKYGKFWAGWDIPRHLYHFNQKSIKAYQEEFGLELKTIKPMKFDSFYVSLLSEGYLDPNASLISRYIRAFLAGIKSNQSAKAPGQFSSNIYVFQKK